MMTRLASKPTFVPHSVVWGAISSTLPIPTDIAKTILAIRPAGIVLGSVSMKNRKMRTSGEITIVRQKSLPQTGPKAQSAVMQCPDPARIAVPMASVSQYVAAIASRFRRRVTSIPPPTISR